MRVRTILVSVAFLLLCVSVQADWYPGIIHSHSTFSDGTRNPESLIEKAKKSSALFLIPTDHYEQIGKEKKFGGTIADDFGFDNYRKRFTTTDLVVISGAEVTKTSHTLAIGDIKKDDALMNAKTQQEVIGRIKELGWLSVAAHPGSKKYPYDVNAANGICGIEFFNDDSKDGYEKTRDFYLSMLKKGENVFVTAGCDSHYPIDPQDSARWQRKTWVECDNLDKKSILEAIAQGRTYVACKGAQVKFYLNSVECKPGFEYQKVTKPTLDFTLHFEKETKIKVLRGYRDGKVALQYWFDEYWKEHPEEKGDKNYSFAWPDPDKDTGGGKHWYVLEAEGFFISSPIRLDVTEPATSGYGLQPNLQVPALEVKKTYPENGAQNILPNVVPAIRFNLPLDKSTIANAISISPAGTIGEYIPYDLPKKGPPKIVLAGSNKVKLTDYYFCSGITYTITINTALKAENGGSLRDPFKFHFTVAPKEVVGYNDWAPQPISSGYWGEALTGFGNTIAFLSDRDGDIALYIANRKRNFYAENTKVRRIVNFGGFCDKFAFSPGGKKVLALNKSGIIYVLYLDKKQIEVERVRDLHIASSLQTFPTWVSDDEFCFGQPQGGIMVAELSKDGEDYNTLKIREPREGVQFLTVRKDGSGHSHICVVDADENIKKWLTNGKYNCLTPEVEKGAPLSLTPIGMDFLKDIVFASDKTGDLEIYKMSWSMTGAKWEWERITDSKGEDITPCWMGTGEQILFVSKITGKYRIWCSDNCGRKQEEIDLK